ncbi:MAG: FHA domain-containing protein [Bdellovibrio sp.]|nr:FHA domain-containing protein [Bdellovibrio sp.]
MARLVVRLKGKPVYDITLAEDKVYVAGRKEDCDIVLDSEKGISREHVKISFINGQWHVEVMSRYGEVSYQGQQTQQFDLEHGGQFSIPPYEFDFSDAGFDSSAHLPATLQGDSNEDFQGSEEKTVIGVAPTAAFIKMVDAENQPIELLRLDAGDSWVAGRESTCHIHIRDQRVSRRQFEIRRVGSQYHIIDLGSVNGTLLNGNPLSTTDTTPLKSGDAISVLSNYLYFELHDASFQSRLEMVNLPPTNLVRTDHYDVDQAIAPYQQPQAQEMIAYQQGGAIGYPNPMGAPPTPLPPVTDGKFDFQKHRPKIIAGAVALLAVVYMFTSDEGGVPPAANPGAVAGPGSPLEAFNKLKPEQQALVRQRYKDAKNLYMQGKYQLAQDEIVKIQELVPEYEDIREIERLSKEAVFIQEQARRQEEIEKSKIEIEDKIQKQAVICKKKINPAITMTDMDDCLSPVLQFNPDHPRISELKSQVEIITMQRDAKAAERSAYLSSVARLRGIYESAQKVHNKGKPLDAISAYEKVLGSSLPDPNGLKKQSRRNIASIRQKMNSKTASYQADADKYYQAQNLKAAILSLRKARSIDPSNTELQEKIEGYVSELRKNMMVIYQEGILEESFGNVDGGESKAGAKDKWKKIIETDIPDGEYYKKAYLKLKKYGAL